MPKKKKDTNHENAIIEPADMHVFNYIKENHAIAGADYNVLPYLSVGAQIMFVKYIADTVFTDSGYTPALFDYAQRYATLVCYTDIAVPANENSADDTCEVLYGTDIIADILSKTNTTQYNALVSAARDQIANTNNLIASYSPADDMYASINSILDKVNAWLDENLDKLNFDEKTLSGIKDISGKFANIPDGDLAKEIVKQAKKGTSKSRNNVVDFLEKN